jgi:hypothetical protein
MDSEGFQAECVERKEQQSYPVAVLAKGECVFQRVKYIRVEKVQGVSESLVVIPPQNPSDKIWVASIYDSVAQSSYIRPGQYRREKTEPKDNQEFPHYSYANESANT